MTGRQSVVRQEAARACMALPGVPLGGTGTPSLRRTSSIRSRMVKMDWPAMGFAPEGNSAAIRTRMAARAPEEGGEVFAAAGEAGAGVLAAVEAGAGV